MTNLLIVILFIIFIVSVLLSFIQNYWAFIGVVGSVIGLCYIVTSGGCDGTLYK